MNYESDTFQDYESITIDELKEQSNNLLDRVTEEQHPLRVCMNMAKILLTLQDTDDSSVTDFFGVSLSHFNIHSAPPGIRSRCRCPR